MSKIKLEFKVNDYITLRLIKNKAVILVNDRQFRQCKYLLLINPQDKEGQESINSIDEAAEVLRNDLEKNLSVEELGITPEEEFWAHCSNLQAWVEHDYDTRLLHSNLSFPLLKKLAEAGDPRSRRVFKEEIGKRLNNGSFSVINYLTEEKYISYLNREEYISILENYDYEWLEFEELMITYLKKFSAVSQEIVKELFDALENFDYSVYREPDYNFSKLVQDEDYGIQFYYLLKEILRNKMLKNEFLGKISKDLKEKSSDSIPITILECFLFFSNKNEIKELFGDSLQVFYELFYQIVMADLFKIYCGDVLIKSIGKSMSSFITSKISEVVEQKNVKLLYQMSNHGLFNCLNIEDTIYMFKHEGLNLTRFLLEEIDHIDDFSGWLDPPSFKKMREQEVLYCISRSLLDILPNHKIQYDDDNIFICDHFFRNLYCFHFLTYLTTNDFQALIDNSDVDLHHILIEYGHFLRKRSSKLNP